MITPLDTKFHFHSTEHGPIIAVLAMRLAKRCKENSISVNPGDLRKLIFGCVYDGPPLILLTAARVNLECLRKRSFTPFQNFISEFCTFIPASVVKVISDPANAQEVDWDGVQNNINRDFACGLSEPERADRLYNFVYGDSEDPSGVYKKTCNVVIIELYEMIRCSGNIGPTEAFLEKVTSYHGSATVENEPHAELVAMIPGETKLLDDFEQEFKTNPDILACVSAYKSVAATFGIE